jgi:hypothetical protein
MYMHVCTAYPVCCSHSLSMLLFVQNILFASGTAYLFAVRIASQCCCLYKISCLFPVQPTCLLFVHFILFAVCTIVQPIFFAVCTLVQPILFVVCTIVQPIFFAVCTAHTFCCLYNCTTYLFCCLYSPYFLLSVKPIFLFAILSLSWLLSVQPILFVVCTSYHLCCLHSRSCLLPVQPILFDVCTAYPVCCSSSLSCLLPVHCTDHPLCCLYRLSCLLFVQTILFAVYTTRLFCCLYIHPIIFAICTVYCLSYLMLVHFIMLPVKPVSFVPFLQSVQQILFVVCVQPTHVCTDHPVCCSYSLSCFLVCTTCLVCCLHTTSPVYDLRTNPFAVHGCTLYSVQPILFSVRTGYPFFTVFCLYSLTSCLLSV